MTLLGNISPPLIQETLFEQMSVLDLFLPGFTNIASAVSSNSHLMCIFALVALLKPYAFMLWVWFIEHCSLWSKSNSQNSS